MARVIDWNTSDPNGTLLTFARTVVLDDGVCREVHLTQHAADALADTTGCVEGTGITPEDALATMQQAHLIFGGRGLWATPVYEMSDAEAIKGDVRGF